MRPVDNPVDIRDLLQAVQDLSSSTAIRESANAYPIILTTHVVSMCMFAGLVVMMDLRLLGIGQTFAPFSQVQQQLFPWQMAGMALSAATGLVLFYAEPLRFYGNVFFGAKVGLMMLAGVNALAFHRLTYPSVIWWDTRPAMPRGAVVAGGVSLALWALVIISGRLIAYNWFD